MRELSKLAGLTPVEGNFFSEFMSSATSLLGGSSVMDLVLRPSCPSMQVFRKQILERVSKGGGGGGLRWGRSSDGERGSGGGGPEVAFVIKAEWEYAMIKASELKENLSVRV